MTKLTVSQAELANAIKVIKPSKKATADGEIHQHALIRCLDSKMKITARNDDSDITAILTLEEPVDKMAMTVPLNTLKDLVSALSGSETVSLKKGKSKKDQTKHTLTAKGTRSRYTLCGLPPIDFPLIDADKKGTTFKVDAKQLVHQIALVHYCVPDTDARYYLNGICFDADGNKITLIGTDGHRLSKTSFDIEAELEPTQVIVATKTIQDIKAILNNVSGDVEITLTENHLKVVADNITIMTRLIDGRFPDTQRVIPRANANQVVVEREVIKQALNRARILSNEKFRGARIRFDGDNIRIETNNPSQEVAVEEFEAVSSNMVNMMEIGVNIDYLSQTVNSMSADHMTFNLGGTPETSMLLNSPSEQDLIAVIMPMRF